MKTSTSNKPRLEDDTPLNNGKCQEFVPIKSISECKTGYISPDTLSNLFNEIFRNICLLIGLVFLIKYCFFEKEKGDEK